MAGLDPAIGYPHQIANDAIPVSNHPMEMAGSSLAMTWLDRCVWYVNKWGGWYHTKRRNDRLSNLVMAGLVPAISARTELAKRGNPRQQTFDGDGGDKPGQARP